MKIFYFSKSCVKYFFCDSYFYATVQKFRVLDYAMLHATILGTALKDLVSFDSRKSLFLVGKTYLRKADSCNHNEKNKYFNSVYFFNFLN